MLTSNLVGYSNFETSIMNACMDNESPALTECIAVLRSMKWETRNFLGVAIATYIAIYVYPYSNVRIINDIGSSYIATYVLRSVIFT